MEKGFYLGTERIQPLTLICNYPAARLYMLGVNPEWYQTNGEMICYKMCIPSELFRRDNEGSINN